MKQEAEELSTRDHIVQAADLLFYERGFEKTSFADIAESVKISRGNFYYHFKSKDDILAAVIELRAANTAAMLEGWARKASTPLARLRCFAEMLIHGNAGMIFGQFRTWLREQFEALGHGPDADALAMHLLSRSQGIASLANAFHDERFIRHEVQMIENWLESLPVRSVSGRGKRSVS
jgi:TetR/AcrR family transcriptional repressor of nem operon